MDGKVHKILFALSILCLLGASGMWVREEFQDKQRWVDYSIRLKEYNANITDRLNEQIKYTDNQIDEWYSPNDTTGIPELKGYYYNITRDTAAGRYNPNVDTITLYKGRTPTTVLHEIGHRIWWTKLNETQRDEWVLIHNESNETVSDYALTDEKEDFAETIEWWYSAQEINSTIRYSFIQNNKETWEDLNETKNSID